MTAASTVTDEVWREAELVWNEHINCGNDPEKALRAALDAAVSLLAPQPDALQPVVSARARQLLGGIRMAWHEGDGIPMDDAVKLAQELVTNPAPQPVVDREALVSTFLETFDKGGLWDGLEPEAYKVRLRTEWATTFADAVLALINGTAK